MKREHGGLFRLQTSNGPTQLTLGFGLQFQHQIAIHVGIQYFGMNVAFAADGRCVAEPRGDLFDGGAKVAFGLCCAVKILQFIQSHCRENRPRPSAEVFRADIFAGDFPEIAVHVS